MWLLAAELREERVAEARVDVPEEAEEGAAEAEEKVQKHHQLQVSEKLRFKHLIISKSTSVLCSDAVIRLMHFETEFAEQINVNLSTEFPSVFRGK